MREGFRQRSRRPIFTHKLGLFGFLFCFCVLQYQGVVVGVVSFARRFLLSSITFAGPASMYYGMFWGFWAPQKPAFL